MISREHSFSALTGHISERKKYLNEHLLFRKLVNLSNDIFLVICPHTGIFIDVNDTVCKILGYCREQMLQMKITDISLKSNNLDIWREHINTLREQEKMIVECNYLKNDGGVLPVEISTRLVNVHGLEYVVAIARDISKRKEAEEKLKCALNDRNKLLSNIKDAFFSMDAGSNTPIILSKAHEDIYGYSLNDFFDNPNLWFEVIHPEDKSMILEKMQLFKKGETTYDEHRIIRRDGKIIWVEGKVTPTLDANGKVIRIDGYVSDISKRKKAERLKDEKINDLNTFIYKATHDLKSPLSNLEGLIRLAGKEKEVKNKNSYFKMIEQSVQRMKGMLNDLTTIIETPHKKITADIINFKNLMEEIKNDFRHLPEFMGIKYTARILQNHEFRSNKKLLLCIMQNLINNSIKYRTSHRPFISILIEEDRKGIKINVKDNGIGISENYCEKIFEMFFRGTELSKGTGLGLYIVKTSVEKLMGKITVESKEKSGTSFTVYLPDLQKYFLTHNIE